MLLVVPLSLSSGIDAGLAYLLSLARRLTRLGNRLLRPAAVLAAVGGRVRAVPGVPLLRRVGRRGRRPPPTIAMTVAAALLGVGVHVLTSLRGLVDDNRAGRRHLPLRLALRLGAPRLLVLASAVLRRGRRR